MEKIVLARGTAKPGDQIAWLNPELCETASEKSSLEDLIHQYGDGPFSLKEIKSYPARSLVVIEDQFGKLQELHPSWFVTA